MKVYISQPMRGLTKEEIMHTRRQAYGRIEFAYPLHVEDMEILDTFFDDFDGNKVQHLGKSIQKLGEADVAVFLRGWKDARECRIEHSVAVEYDIDRLYFN